MVRPMGWWDILYKGGGFSGLRISTLAQISFSLQTGSTSTLSVNQPLFY